MTVELVRTVKVTNKYGLHARASTLFVETASDFASNVYLSRPGGEEVDGKSILGILTLGAEKGQTLQLRVSGDDAQGAMDALVGLIENNFGED